MTVPLFHVDAFADRPFAGNPAAVCLLPDWKEDRWLQAVAGEMNLSETAFLVERPGHFDLRWFTPRAEVDLCGHATLASAHVLWQQGQATGDEIRFSTRSGILTARNEARRDRTRLPARTGRTGPAAGRPPGCAGRLSLLRRQEPLRLRRGSGLRGHAAASGAGFPAAGDRPLPGRDRHEPVGRPPIRLRVTGVLPPAGRGRRPGVRLGPLLPGRLLAEAARQGRVRGVPGVGQGRRGEGAGRRGPGRCWAAGRSRWRRGELLVGGGRS